MSTTRRWPALLVSLIFGLLSACATTRAPTSDSTSHRFEVTLIAAPQKNRETTSYVAGALGTVIGMGVGVLLGLGPLGTAATTPVPGGVADTLPDTTVPAVVGDVLVSSVRDYVQLRSELATEGPRTVVRIEPQSMVWEEYPDYSRRRFTVRVLVTTGAAGVDKPASVSHKHYSFMSPYHSAKYWNEQPSETAEGHTRLDTTLLEGGNKLAAAVIKDMARRTH